MLIKSEFSQTLKIANVTPVYKKDSRNDETNYRPVRILSNLSKMYEKYMFNEIAEYFDILSKYQCGFRKGISSQHCLLVLIEKWKKIRF